MGLGDKPNVFLQLFVQPGVLERGLQCAEENRRDDEGEDGVDQTAGQLGEHFGGDGVERQTVHQLAEDEGLEHVQRNVGQRAEDGAEDDSGMVGAGGSILPGGMIADQAGHKRDGALVDKGDDALGAPAGDDVVQAGAKAGSQKSGARAEEQAAEHAQRIGHVQLRTHEGDAQIVDDENDRRHQADEADSEGFVPAGCHRGSPFLSEMESGLEDDWEMNCIIARTGLM